jgi:hypothetical protein
MEELAEVAGMAVSTLHHHVRAITAMSPLQCQKQIRLRATRAGMLADDVDAASVAFEVDTKARLPDSNSPPRRHPISHSFCLSVLGETVACIDRPRVVAKCLRITIRGSATLTRNALSADLICADGPEVGFEEVCRGLVVTAREE